MTLNMHTVCKLVMGISKTCPHHCCYWDVNCFQGRHKLKCIRHQTMKLKLQLWSS